MEEYQEYTVRVYKTRRVWLQDGEVHRTDGPAIEYANGCKEWWVDGNRII